MKITLAVCALLLSECSALFADPLARPLMLTAQVEGTDKAVTTALVKQVNFEGNTVFTDAQLMGVIGSSLAATADGLDGLRKLAAQVEAHYRENGYPNAKVIIPEQEVKAGAVTFQVVEPKLGEVTVTGNQRYSEGVLRKAFRGIDHNGVLRVRALERKLLIVSDYPGLTAKASLQAGKAAGTTDVVINVEEAPKLTTASTEFNTFGSRQASKERFVQKVAWRNLSGRGDELSLGVVAAPNPGDLLYGQLHYTTPFGTNGTKIHLSGAGGNFEVGQEFAILGIKGTGRSWGASVSHPVLKRADRTVSVEFGLESNDAELELLGARSSYDKVRSLKAGVSVEDRDARTKTRNVGSVYLHRGLGDALGGMPDNAPLSSRRGADGRFTKLVLDYAHVKQVDDRTFVVAQVSGQLTDSPLVAGEQFDVGGANSVRGYPQSELLGDSGLRISLELRRTSSLRSMPDWVQDLQVVAFLDHGRISNKNPVPGQPGEESLTGIGLGLRAELTHDVSVRADLGYGLSREPSSGGKLQPYLQVAHQY